MCLYVHELPLVLKIINKASAHAVENGAKAVRDIVLVVGDNSGYVADSIQMYFDIAAEGTPCAGAQLIVKRIKPKLKCSGCGALFERRPFSFACPDCGADGNPTEIGKELYLEAIHIIVEPGDEPNAEDDTRTGDGSDTGREREARPGHVPGL